MTVRAEEASRESPRDRRAIWQARVAALAVGMACLFTLALALHRVDDYDLGYHLAYGETFIARGRIVDSNEFVYTRIDPRVLAQPGNLPPGGWFDARTQRLRFPNANYLSQILMALAFRAAGFAGIVGLQVILVAVMLGLWLKILQRLRVPWLVAAAGVLLAALATFERYGLRPELFGYVVLLAQLYLLTAPRLGWRRVAGLIAAQWVFVQLHSYWLLGLGLGLAFLSEAALRVWSTRRSGPPVARGEAHAHAAQLAVALAGMILVAFLNPWGPRLVGQPLATLLFLRLHAASAAGAGLDAHPWSQVTECQSPFARLYLRSSTTYALIVTLVLAATGAVAAFWRRHWAYAALLAGMVLVALSMRRNVGVGCLVLVPVSLAAWVDAAGAWRAGRLGAHGRADMAKSTAGLGARTTTPLQAAAAGRWVSVGAGALLTLIALQGILDVVTSRFYYREHRRRRFGLTAAPRDLPFSAARVLREVAGDSASDQARAARVFTSYNVSSAILFFGGNGRSPREVPILTNQWAYPATTMAENFRLTSAEGDFDAFARAYDVGWVVLDCTREHSKLARLLLHQRSWKLIDFDGLHVLLMRPDLNADAAQSPPRTPPALIAEIRATEPFPAFSLQRAGAALHLLDLSDDALAFCRAAVTADARYAPAWQMLGVILATRGARELQANAHVGAAWQDVREAADCFRTALRLRPNDRETRENLRRAEAMLARAPR